MPTEEVENKQVFSYFCVGLFTLEIVALKLSPNLQFLIRWKSREEQLGKKLEKKKKRAKVKAKKKQGH